MLFTHNVSSLLEEKKNSSHYTRINQTDLEMINKTENNNLTLALTGSFKKSIGKRDISEDFLKSRKKKSSGLEIEPSTMLGDGELELQQPSEYDGFNNYRPFEFSKKNKFGKVVKKAHQLQMFVSIVNNIFKTVKEIKNIAFPKKKKQNNSLDAKNSQSSDEPVKKNVDQLQADKIKIINVDLKENLTKPNLNEPQFKPDTRNNYSKNDSQNLISRKSQDIPSGSKKYDEQELEKKILKILYYRDMLKADGKSKDTPDITNIISPKSPQLSNDALTETSLTNQHSKQSLAVDIPQKNETLSLSFIQLGLGLLLVIAIINITVFVAMRKSRSKRKCHRKRKIEYNDVSKSESLSKATKTKKKSHSRKNI